MRSTHCQGKFARSVEIAKAELERRHSVKRRVKEIINT